LGIGSFERVLRLPRIAPLQGSLQRGALKRWLGFVVPACGTDPDPEVPEPIPAKVKPRKARSSKISRATSSEYDNSAGLRSIVV